MHLPHLLALPPAIIALCAATPGLAAEESQWPHNVPRHLKYFPEDEVHAKCGLSVKQRLQHEKPIGVKKMSMDEGEMFMLDNWIFAAQDTPSQPQSSRRSDYDVFGNATSQALSPLRPLAQSDWLARMHIRDILMNRQFKCPDGTASCESIGAPDVCCGTGSTCISVTGSSVAGDVGCCPSGQTCAGSVSCDEASGYTSCPGTDNGGCCLPGFKCQGIGCVAEGTSTSFVQPSTSSSTPSATSTSTTAAAIPTTSSTTSTTPEPTSTSTSRSAYTCSTGWFSCPASLGGGCCMNGRTCATGASCLGDDDNPSSTRAPDAPVRPTSAAVTTGASSDNICPTGFYVCSAYYPSGCCRVGRDCQTTGSCALPRSDTIVNTNGVVIVAPTGAESAGSCPSAWYSCPADAGGNCCPNGYACGEQCTATASGQSGVTSKAEPSSSSSSSQASFVSRLSVWGMAVASFGCGLGMIVL
ncbi:hypothetical protein IG631_19912 [Alternaria alternata]|nr:hypothetical protein IG631_19912 [Alternaria alternata]